MNMRFVAFVLSLLVAIPSVVLAEDAGNLLVEVNQMQQSTVAIGAQRVEVLTLTFHADCSQYVTVEAITLHHTGRGDAADIARVYALEGLRRISRARTVQSSDQSVHLRFGRWTISPCESKTMRILVDMRNDAQSFGEHAFTLVASDITTDAHVSIQTSVTEASFHTVTAQPVGSISVSYPSLNTPIYYGRMRTVGRILLSADNAADQEISAITLTNDGSARNDDLQHIQLRTVSGRSVSTTAQKLDNDRVRLSFDPPLQIDKNNTILLYIRADVLASRRRTIRFLVEEPSDVEARSVRRRR